MFNEVLCIISGKVQRVGYRDFVTEVTKMRGLTGYVKNNDDGTVEVLAQGTPDDLKALIEELHEGSVLSVVEGVNADWRGVSKPFDDFKVL